MSSGSQCRPKALQVFTSPCVANRSLMFILPTPTIGKQHFACIHDAQISCVHFYFALIVWKTRSTSCHLLWLLCLVCDQHKELGPALEHELEVVTQLQVICHRELPSSFCKLDLWISLGNLLRNVDHMYSLFLIQNHQNRVYHLCSSLSHKICWQCLRNIATNPMRQHLQLNYAPRISTSK